MAEENQFKEIEELTHGFKGIPITDYALEKMKTYAELAGSSEIYGFLVCQRRNKSRIIEDAILAINQEASGASAGLSGTAAGESKDELKRLGLVPIGFWHSHGNFDTWHSSTDDGNLDTYMEALAANTESTYSKKPRSHHYIDHENSRFIAVIDGKQVSIGIDPENFTYIYKLDSQRKTNEEKIVIEMKNKKPMILKDGFGTLILRGYKGQVIDDYESDLTKTLGVAYSVVVNRRKKVYGELFISRWCSFCESIETKVVKDAEIIEIPTGKFSLDKDELTKDLEERVVGFKYNPRRGTFLW